MQPFSQITFNSKVVSMSLSRVVHGQLLCATGLCKVLYPSV